jgi:hypothetical protein
MGPQGETTHRCRLLITRRKASEILLLPRGTIWTLPCVDIDADRRIAEQLTREAARVWGLEAYCLIPPNTQSKGRNFPTWSAVMEVVDHNCRPAPGTFWTPGPTAMVCSDPQDASSIQELLSELDSYRRGYKIGPFAQPGWVLDLFRWAQDQVTPLGLRLTGNFRQLNASPTFSLIRMETNDCALWFKATGKPNAHELSITTTLQRLFPEFLPLLLGIHQEWNGWLSLEAPGSLLDEANDFRAWERAAETLADLQIASILKTGELLDSGAKDLRISKLAEQIPPFLAGMQDLMARQEKTSPAPLGRSELDSLARALNRCCTTLESLRIPDTLGHIDFNPGNILVSPGRCVFLDWAEAAVTNPVLTFEYFSEHLSQRGIAGAEARERLLSAYLPRWSVFCPVENLRRALALSPSLAAFAHTVANDSWRTNDTNPNPTFAAYFRSLTRRMYREAISAIGDCELCLG